MDQQDDLMRTLLACATSLMETGAAAALDAQAKNLSRGQRRQIAGMLKVASDGAAHIVAVVDLALNEPYHFQWARRPASETSLLLAGKEPSSGFINFRCALTALLPAAACASL